MTAILPLVQPSNWAKRDHRPPVKAHKDPLSRDYLTKDEVEAMIAAAKKACGRTADRDALLIMLAYRHGLRASELTALRWDQVDLKAGRLHVARLKHGDPSTHPLRGPELRAIRAWKRRQGESAHIFLTSLRGGPMTRRTVHYVVAEAAKAAGIPSPVHLICCGTARASTWRTRGTTQGRCSFTSATKISAHREIHPTRGR